MAKLKVYGGNLYQKGGRFCRAVVAASSRPKAALILGQGLGHFRNYWSETGNQAEIEIAMSRPGVVFTNSRYGRFDFTAVVLVDGVWLPAGEQPAAATPGPAAVPVVERPVRSVEDEETRLAIAHYRAEFRRLSVLASNAAKSRSVDPADYRADLKSLIDQAQRFLEA